ncbi:hypothetical protein [Sphaerisporangium sp. NPDC051011]|uniref:hypothetical protein n=1 Tax=Sphaerisporangium sp. NPDC051011 TaxID=3155792 RepID=UPI0033C21A5F
MRRRVVIRYSCLALVFLLAGFAVWWVRYKSPLYQSVVTVAFITKTNHFAGEVYDHFTDNHIFMALATARYFDNPGTQERLRAMGGTADFSYKVAHWGNEELPVYGQPYATLQSLSDDPKESIDTLNLALKLLTQKVEKLQTSSGASGRVMIKWETIGSIFGPQRQPLQKSRATVGIGLIAVLASAAVMSMTRDRSKRDSGSPPDHLMMTTVRRPKPPHPGTTT